MIGEGEQPYAHAGHGDDRCRIAKEWLPGCRDDGVGRANGKTDNVLELPGAIRRVLVVVIAERHEVVAQGIHHREHGGTAREVRQQLIAKRVAGVHEHDIPRAAPLPNVVHGSGEAGKATDDSGARVLLRTAARIARLRGGVAGIDVKFAKVAVNVVRVQNAKGARGAACGGRRSAAGGEEQGGKDGARHDQHAKPTRLERRTSSSYEHTL